VYAAPSTGQEIACEGDVVTVPWSGRFLGVGAVARQVVVIGEDAREISYGDFRGSLLVLSTASWRDCMDTGVAAGCNSAGVMVPTVVLPPRFVYGQVMAVLAPVPWLVTLASGTDDYGGQFGLTLR